MPLCPLTRQIAIHSRYGDFKSLRYLIGRLPTLDSVDNTLPQLLRIRFHAQAPVVYYLFMIILKSLYFCKPL